MLLLTSVSNPVLVQNLSYENEFYSHVHFHANETHFYLIRFAPGLVLKQTQRATRKRSIFGENHGVWKSDETLSRVFDISFQSKQDEELRSKRRNKIVQIYAN